MNEETKLKIAIISDALFMAVILIVSLLTLNEVQHDPLDVNRDGEANLTDLSVLAAELNVRHFEQMEMPLPASE